MSQPDPGQHLTRSFAIEEQYLKLEARFEAEVAELHRENELLRGELATALRQIEAQGQEISTLKLRADGMREGLLSVIDKDQARDYRVKRYQDLAKRISRLVRDSKAGAMTFEQLRSVFELTSTEMTHASKAVCAFDPEIEIGLAPGSKKAKILVFLGGEK